MGVLQRFEQRLENAVSGAFARVFQSAVQPVEIAAALQREIDSGAQILSRDRVLVPNDFTVELSQADFDRLAPYGGTLSGELSELVHEHVNEQRYTLAGPLRLDFVPQMDLSTGRFRIHSRASAAVVPAAGTRMTDTAVAKAPVVLEVNGIRHPVEPPGVVIGRGTDAQMRINDPGVSRKHAQLRVIPEGAGVRVTIEDLGSTNGLVVDGRRTTHAVLSDGSQIQIGNTLVVVRNPHAGGRVSTASTGGGPGPAGGPPSPPGGAPSPGGGPVPSGPPPSVPRPPAGPPAGGPPPAPQAGLRPGPLAGDPRPGDHR
ncbi:FHA domain-containing protein [Mumia flava]|uniref:FHA domain-containing protein n=1 Tax=Mumia flava TaxID=1348852 RepID=A0A2M9BI33_9ACTN|nr:FHA domain-containing protein [Mumia flava]